MLYAILIAFTLAALLAAIVLFITKRPATQRARVSRALTADNAPKYLQRRRAA